MLHVAARKNKKAPLFGRGTGLYITIFSNGKEKNPAVAGFYIEFLAV